MPMISSAPLPGEISQTQATMHKQLDLVHRSTIGRGLFPAMHGDAVVRMGEAGLVTWMEGCPALN
jgi:hypothetical protein